jgi:hypothetical protein
MPQNFEFQQARRFSSLPLVVKPSSDGYLLAENAQPKPQQSHSVAGWIVGGFFLIIFSWFFLIVGIIFLAVALLYRPTRRYLRAFFLLQPGELIFSHYPLHLGQDDRVTFRRRLKGDRKFPQNGTVTVRLLCVERVSYTKGTDQVTETALITEKTLRQQSVFSGSKDMVCHFDLDLPAHLPPSFEGKNNQIRWVIVVSQNLPQIAEDIESNFTLFVDP